MNLKTHLVVGFLFLAHVAAAQTIPQETKLVGVGTNSGNPGYDFYVHTVALSGDGAIAVVGGRGDGAARVYERSGGVWSKQPGIPVGSDAVDTLGPAYSAAISADGTTVIVGGPLDDAEEGAAWVYTRTGGVWSQKGAKLIGHGDISTSWQGVAVAISAYGSTAVVGAPSDSGTGAAWVFTRSEGLWAQQGGPLVGTGLDCSQCFQGMAVSVSGDGDTIIVGAPYAGEGGAAWVFTRSDGVWSQQGVLVGSGITGQAYQGYSVAISADGSTAIVGGPGDADGTGAAWVFVRAGGLWSQQGPKLVGSGAVGNARQGSSVAISGDGSTAIVGGPEDDGDAGAAWMFTRTGGAWSQKGNKLVGSGAIGRAYQGEGVAVSANGTTLLVGGPNDGDGGAAWVYWSPPPSAWVPVVAHSDGANGSRWRSDLGLLNPGTSTATAEVRFHGPGGVVSTSIVVPAGAQSVLSDVVGLLGMSGQGALEVAADPPLKMTARTYSWVAQEAGCFAGGTLSQEYPLLDSGGGLRTGQSAYLPALVEDDAFRCNIGVVNTGAEAATVLVELFDGMGTKLAEYTVQMAPGRWKQAAQPFRELAGQAAMRSGYARVTVQTGSGVFALASVIDNVTNDATTIPMQQ